MTPAAFVAVALGTAFGLGSVLTRMRWLVGMPRLGVMLWALAVAALPASMVAAGVTATTPLLRDVGGVREFVHRCPRWVFALWGHRLALLAAAGGTTVVLVVAGAGAVALVGQVRQLRRDAGQYLPLVLTAVRRHDGVIVVTDERPAAWSLASGCGYVVMTSAAVAALSADEFSAVVAHERAHLSGRHHLQVAVFRAARRAFPCPLTRSALRQVSELLEMRADDAAVRASGNHALAAALVRLAAVAPAGALGVGGAASALHRLQRLLDPPRPARRQAGAATLAAAAGTLLPVAVATVAATAVMSLHFCPAH